MSTSCDTRLLSCYDNITSDSTRAKRL